MRWKMVLLLLLAGFLDPLSRMEAESYKRWRLLKDRSLENTFKLPENPYQDFEDLNPDEMFLHTAFPLTNPIPPAQPQRMKQERIPMSQSQFPKDIEEISETHSPIWIQVPYFPLKFLKVHPIRILFFIFFTFLAWIGLVFLLYFLRKTVRPKCCIRIFPDENLPLPIQTSYKKNESIINQRATDSVSLVPTAYSPEISPHSSETKSTRSRLEPLKPFWENQRKSNLAAIPRMRCLEQERASKRLAA